MRFPDLLETGCQALSLTPLFSLFSSFVLLIFFPTQYLVHTATAIIRLISDTDIQFANTDFSVSANIGKVDYWSNPLMSYVVHILQIHFATQVHKVNEMILSIRLNFTFNLA